MQEPPPSPFWAVNSDHGLSFAGEETRTMVWVSFSLQIYSTFEFWRFKFSVVWVLVWVSSFYGEGGGSHTVKTNSGPTYDFSFSIFWPPTTPLSGGEQWSSSWVQFKREPSFVSPVLFLALVALNRRFWIENRAIQNRAIRVVRFQGRFEHW